jgi:superfamily II DNA or RNA helicase
MDENQKNKYKKLMNVEYNYPSPSDTDFQYKIYKKREFYYNKIPHREKILDNYDDIKEYRDNICARNFKPHEHQILLSNFINPHTPYKGILIFHGTGTGKTCAAITIAEKFKEMVQKYNTKIYVLVNGPIIKQNWKNELIKCTGETYMQYLDKSVYQDNNNIEQLRKEAIANAFEYYKFMSYKSFYKKVLGEKIRERNIVDGKIEYSYRKTEDGEYERDLAIDSITDLDNSLLIIDEAHNITGNDYGNAIKKIINNSVNLKVVLLTATPMKNLADDIISLLNLLRPSNSPIRRDMIFTNERNYLMKFKQGGIDYLKKMAKGYVSYLRGADPITFAERVEMGVIPKGLLFTRVIKCKMLPFQLNIYNKTAQDEDDTLDKKSEAVANFVFPSLSDDKKEIIPVYGIKGINILKNQLKNNLNEINNLVRKKILNTTKKENLIYLTNNNKTITGDFLKKDNLKYFSIKFHTALNNLLQLVKGKKGLGTAFIYSNLVQVGVNIFQEILLQNGFLEYQENKNYNIKKDTLCYSCGEQFSNHNKNHTFYPATFVSVTGSGEDIDVIPEEKQKILTNVFNKVENKDGKNIKFVLGSEVMKEGITLENVKEVHILDVHYNLGKVDQIIGRAIRHCVHYNITNDENRFPKVNVYKYVISIDNGLTTEEKLYKKAELKYKLIKQIERALKKIAIDCPLNRPGNVFPEELIKYKDCEKNNNCPAICDYMNCNYKCENPKLNKQYFDGVKYVNLNKNEIDYSTLTTMLAKNEIDHAKSQIKNMYKIKYVYKLNNIVDYVYNSYDKEKQKLFDKFFVYKALNELLPSNENDFNNFKDTILDKYNKPGYLIHRGKYYIFQPFDQKENLPFYYRTQFNKPNLHKLLLTNYMHNTKNYNIFDGHVKSDISDKSKYIYDFESVQEYYDNKKEFSFVGIIDKNKAGSDVFKIRNKRAKILDKKRGTGIPSLKGAVCTTKSKDDILIIIKKINNHMNKLNLLFTPAIKGTSRENLCEIIKQKLLYLESNVKGLDKLTYIIIPKNHPVYKFPYNIEDRVKYLKKKIKSKTNINVTIKSNKIMFDNNNQTNKFESFLKKLGGKIEKNKWIFIVTN